MTEPIIVVLQTYQRTDYALTTIARAREFLSYDGPLYWYVADDGSDELHYDSVMNAVHTGDYAVIGSHSERLGYGGNANKALAFCQQHTSLTFWLEDDWALSEPLYLDVYAEMLMERADVGMVRLGYLNTGISGHITAHNHHMHLSLDHEPIASEQHQIVFTGHPSLRHQRYFDWYGYYREGLLPGDTELAYAYQYRTRVGGPRIVWPMRYPPNGLFHHIGEIKSETLL